MQLSKLKKNPSNPRLIKDSRFHKLVQSIEQFPKMMDLRPIIYDPSTMIILGGNMRYSALQELKYKEIPDTWVKSADDLTEDEKQRFIVVDNVGFGDWDYDTLSEWDAGQLEDWGVEVADNTNICDVVELENITTTYNLNIKCDDPQELDDIKNRLNIQSNCISAKNLIKHLL